MPVSLIIIDNDKLCLPRTISVFRKWEAFQKKRISRHDWTKVSHSRGFNQAVMARIKP